MTTAVVDHGAEIARLIDQSIALGTECERLAKAGRSTEAGAKNAERARLLDRAEMLRNEGRQAKLDAWRNSPAPGTVPNAVPGGETYTRDDLDDPVVHTQEYREAFGRYLQSAGQRVDRLLHEVQERYAALTVGSDVGGGFTLPAHIQAGILARRAAASPILGLFTPLDSGGRMDVEWPRVQPNATSGSIFTSGFVGSMVGEASSAGEVEPTFGMLSGSLKRGKAYAKFSIDLDLATIEEFLIRDGSQNMALLQEQQSIIGSGIGANCKGILNYSGDGTGDTIKTVDVEGSTSNEISNTISAVGSAPKILDLIYAVPAQYRRSPGFRVVFTSLQEKKIRQLVDAQARFHWSGDGGFGSPADGLLGYKTEVSEFMEDGGTDGNRVLLAGDMSEIIFATRGPITAQVLLERFADSDQEAVVLRSRFVPLVANTDAFRIGIV